MTLEIEPHTLSLSHTSIHTHRNTHTHAFWLLAFPHPLNLATRVSWLISSFHFQHVFTSILALDCVGPGTRQACGPY